MKSAKILICGGHLTPALAVMEYIQTATSWSPVYIGRMYAMEGDRALSLEYTTVTSLGIPFYPLIAARLQRAFTFYTIVSLLKFPVSILQSLWYIERLKPDCIVSFGGYVALPLAIAGWILRIPVMTHEQTSVMGLTNRIISRLANRVCLSWKDTQRIPTGIHTVVTGNPIRSTIISSADTRIISFGDQNLPIIYITGGSQGARAINMVIGIIIPKLISRFRILHQCGSANNSHDLKMLLSVKDSLNDPFRDNYSVVTSIHPNDVGEIYRHAFIVISRSGANTITELAAVGVPAILIPLPHAAAGEQLANAKRFISSGLGELIVQDELTSTTLLAMIETMATHHNRYLVHRDDARILVHINGAKQIVQQIESLLDGNSTS